MSWEEGMPLGAWVRASPPSVACERVTRALLDLYCLEFFQWGMVQTDPNFGNFLVTDDDRLVLLDFGATMEFDGAFRRQYVELLRAVDSGRGSAIVDEGVRFGLLDPRESAETRALFAAMLQVAAEPFAQALQPFSCRDAQYAARCREAAETFVRSLRYSPPPRALLFLHRKLGGLFQLLRKLGVTLDLRAYWEQMLQVEPAALPLTPKDP
jgi:predicted unusual protein kinase regulating ubiquinone biosynthesis (AarF/ABC1/UbiB family)